MIEIYPHLFRDLLFDGQLVIYRASSLEMSLMTYWSENVLEYLYRTASRRQHLLLYDLSNPSVSTAYFLLTGRDTFNVGITRNGRTRFEHFIQQHPRNNVYLSLIVSKSASGVRIQRYSNLKPHPRVTAKIFFEYDRGLTWLQNHIQSDDEGNTRPMTARLIDRAISALAGRRDDLFQFREELFMLVNGSMEVTRISDDYSLTIGRSDIPNQQLGLNLHGYGETSYSVSRIHAVLTLKNNHIYITDLNSRNGTFLSGRRLQPMTPTIIRESDEIYVGQVSVKILF
jgi:hypothetical protein